MSELREEDLQVHLVVDDAGSARAAGAEFARALAGAASEDFAPALAEQEGLSFTPLYGGVGSECHAAARMATPSMLARASAGVR